MKALVTGGTGFVGRTLLEQWPESVAWRRVADLTDAEAVSREIKSLADTGFEAVIHLAAQPNVGESFRHPIQTWEVNTLGTLHLMEALDKYGWRGPFLYVSTGAVYTAALSSITEDSPTTPTSPYAASKLAAETAVFEWGRRTGNRAMVARPFNHSGPGQTRDYFLPEMARQVSALPESGGVVETGNTDVYRDFSHVLDIVEAYRLLLHRGEAGEIYNISSGVSHLLSGVLTRLAELSGRKVEFRVVPERFREESSTPFTVDTGKLRVATDWSPRFHLDDLLQELLKEWETTH